ncbi:39S ribosomal protein L38, mitochondrial-like [Anneissia japonica]|uniref:39S ribosomal protein L38, mitochondrial-like n=1 Tax=Anneissia japonica TaxID=1529436 RepID=UPI001425ADFE|nr:39S ribosomal protein L38, mitochondrial-like [Anneissia japonica]
MATSCVQNMSRLRSMFRLPPRSIYPLITYKRLIYNQHQRLFSSALSDGIDIGLPTCPQSKKLKNKHRSKILHKIKNTPELERLARQRKLVVPLDEVEAEWEKTSGPYHIRDVAKNYNIFKDLFDGAEFISWSVMNISYDVDDDTVMPVYWGNVVTPQEARSPPVISFESSNDEFWTLLLINPDGNLHEKDAENLHWFVANIPGQHVDSGQVLCDYLQPFPPKGTGYHRFVFLLFKQEGKLDLSEEQRQLPCRNLHKRTFDTLEFYRKYQDVITPAGVSFFQCRWDTTVTDVFHHVLEMREPSYEYHPPPLYIAPQVKWPRKKPLKYLNKYLPQE